MPVRRHPVATSKGEHTLSNLPVDGALIARLKASFLIVREHGVRLAEIFYAKLFAAAPHLRPLFRADIASQSEKLIASLDAIVRNLEAPHENAEMLAALGKRHAGYGAKPEHYDLVIDLLVESMRELLDSRADPRMLDEWRTTLRLVSDQMLAASRDASDAKPDAPNAGA